MEIGHIWVLQSLHRYYIPPSILWFYILGSYISGKLTYVKIGMARWISIPASYNGLWSVCCSLPPPPSSSKPTQDLTWSAYRKNAQKRGLGLLVPHLTKRYQDESRYQRAKKAMGRSGCKGEYHGINSHPFVPVPVPTLYMEHTNTTGCV